MSSRAQMVGAERAQSPTLMAVCSHWGTRCCISAWKTTREGLTVCFICLFVCFILSRSARQQDEQR